MTAETLLPERLAMLVYHYREALAPDFGCRPSPSPQWGDLSQEERNRLVAATRLALLDLRSEPSTGSASAGNLPRVPGFADGTDGKECGC